MNNKKPYDSGFFNRLKKKAESLLKDNDKLKVVLKGVVDKIEEVTGKEGKIKTVIDMLKTFVRMVKSYVSGSYRQIPWKSIVLIVAGLLYFLVPLDFIPDFIPFAGFVDDATVIYWIALGIQEDIREFLEWESQGKVTVQTSDEDQATLP